jgi:hypothetical protein
MEVKETTPVPVRRPRENGMCPLARIPKAPSPLSAKERKEAKRKVERGEKVYL